VDLSDSGGCDSPNGRPEKLAERGKEHVSALGPRVVAGTIDQRQTSVGGARRQLDLSLG